MDHKVLQLANYTNGVAIVLVTIVVVLNVNK